MSDLVTYEYALLQVVPRVERGESVNAGVLLYCRRRDVLAVRVHLDRERLAALDPHCDADAVADVLETIAAVAAVPEPPRSDRHATGALAARGPGAGEDIGRRFRRLTTARSTIVRPGPVHTGLTADPHAEADRLLERLVLPLGG
ncbi:hypothetical protein Ae168Ps1_1291c [Pseudonocardia sp. Ae168_Ps1]|uniref:DUF3037 domain-containing protein n=1 Tax=unclassified Pseudonocardia TaxID=2619320 RepID=UPI00094B63A5|nr:MULTISPECIES: DUF3037 domain-containing protein [unclassified Pseudonocardia]OLL72910.1 hypothetical protein Ae150APs1_1288c [Pseudonocardia sp. Ae150A_Ps1]OLL78885.1 hypothetical protein Ae168Ps1_1291c [Pseudonocardia sp. Ae168_Ps1]OLL86976.1 hypothetical protein Ae263Ps1_4031 [Pseudonocardia sp. Ae263_Ps1]OLL92980.1 hypothetical protein Ae356Ps1_2877c [Pseudonocardia sp. Ae356_Ps1]